VRIACDLPDGASSAAATETAKKVLALSFPAVSVWPPSPAFSLDFSPNGRLLASGHQDGVSRIWDAATGALVNEIRGHTGQILSVAFDAGASLLVSASLDATVRVWEVSGGKLLSTIANGDLARTCRSTASDVGTRDLLDMVARDPSREMLDARFVGDTPRMVIALSNGLVAILSTDSCMTRRLSSRTAKP
jgi:WD40 repeat protein